MANGSNQERAWEHGSMGTWEHGNITVDRTHLGHSSVGTKETDVLLPQLIYLIHL